MDDPVRHVLERLHDALEDVAHALLLDPVERAVVADDGAPAHLLAGARSIVTALDAVVATDARASAIVDAGDATLYAVHLAGGLAAVLVGPAAWNVALARRTADPLLGELLTDELAELVRRPARPTATAATPPGGTPGTGTRAQALRADAIRHVARGD
ncbi:hypothetical protein Cfla_2624 [Cellulomonas flavigena DSM 20109]|uniref:Roadblock/LC7 family protein n=1 Tax=Cellulomonas flavigena (strain ATCC 482 / DSM 20109 / BCRC 11376 / JCM 18109 / NBRC 3775 / NCIMB 8073 / NRS 134) TaxID=446466 RepID=D5UIU5_CELFN|nr:hypothetical protein [Cellulomonas flavigena]ADG75511.1 hypothetical protein Cfla_2624 [Cellulomonas flavigena DSM 20109]